MEYKHFSHQHPLTLYKVQPDQHFQCYGCHLQCHDSIFACWNCNFFLHEHCGNANRYVKHPAHPPHPLVLTPSPTYCSGSFLCNGCGAPGTTFSYCCPLCEIDLHVNCTYLPLQVASNSRHQHEIHLSFGRKDCNEGDICKICLKELKFRNWYYFCDEDGCEFRVHTFCATSEVKIGMYQDDGTNEEQVEVPASSSGGAEALAEMFMQMQIQNQMAQQINNMINSARPR